MEGDNMKQYIGIKVIKAKPETKEDQEGYKVLYQDGYVSWSPKETFEEAYRIFGYGDLASTSKLMVSPDYKDRFRAEHLQLALRIKGLDKMLQKFREGTLEFTPICSYELLSSQLESMKLYMICLEDRAVQENIDLIIF